MSYYHAGGYQHNNPAYNGTAEKYKPAHVEVPVNQVQVTRTAPKWSWCSTGWSIFATFCCSSFCGFLGLLFSIWSYIDHKSGDYERSRFKRRWSWGCTIFGILLTVLLVVGVLLVIFVFMDDICKAAGSTERDFYGCGWKFT